MNEFASIPLSDCSAFTCPRLLIRSLGRDTVRAIGLEQPCGGGVYYFKSREQSMVEKVRETLGQKYDVVDLADLFFIP